MNTDYHFLSDRRFRVADREYAVREIVDVEGVATVSAEPFPRDFHVQDNANRLFAIDLVVRSLVVEEEIELLEPTFANLA